MAANASLSRAKAVQNDEFYTQYSDIEAEINAYIEFNPDVFRDKVILLPCDDPEWSNFTKYFAANFNRFGLKKLISTSYAKSAGNQEYGKIEYPRYDNYDAIEVPFVECIPSDYDGIMGVPMTFMDRYDPEQFEILGRRGDLKWAETECDFYTPPSPEMQQKYKDMNNTWRVQNTYILSDEGIPLITYGRIFIQSKKGGAK